MHIALTGGTGFIGTHILDRLCAQGHTVRLLVHKTLPTLQENQEQKVTLIKGSLTDPEILKSLTEDVEAVLHCAALTKARKKSDFYKMNTEGTRLLAEAAQKNGVRKILFFSSLAAREPHLSSYADSKHKAEEALKTIDGLKFDIFRPPAVYGEGDTDFLDLFRMIQKGTGLLIAGEEAIVSLVHVEDLVNATLHWLDHVEPSHSTYEIADPQIDGHLWKDVFVNQFQTRGPSSRNLSAFLVWLRRPIRDRHTWPHTVCCTHSLPSTPYSS